MTVPIVIVESPYSGKNVIEVGRNIRYLRAALADCLSRGEAPFASHGLYTQPGVLDDRDPEEREQGIKAGFRFHDVADKMVVYTDLGISSGMQAGVANAEWLGLPIEMRSLEGWSKKEEGNK